MIIDLCIKSISSSVGYIPIFISLFISECFIVGIFSFSTKTNEQDIGFQKFGKKFFRMTLISKFRSISNTLFTKHLFVTNTAVGIFFIGAGDILQQNIEKKLYEGKKFEIKRTGNMLMAGSVFGSLGHFWYKFLDSKFPGQTVKHVSRKLLLDMIVGPPIFFCFFLGIGYLENKPVQQSVKEFKENLLVICTADWAVYAPLQAVNFFYVPPKYRVLYVCVLCLAYDVFLSYILHKEDNKNLVKRKEP